MKVKLRLARWGASNNPLYGIVAAPVRFARDGRHLERLGTYNPVPCKEPDFQSSSSAAANPTANPNANPNATPNATVPTKHIELNVMRIKYWLSVGAHPTERVAWLLSKAGIMPPTAKQLQATGHVSLVDRSLWDVRIKDKESGKILSTISGNEARSTFRDEESGLVPAGIPPVWGDGAAHERFNWADIKVDGSMGSGGGKTVEPLSDSEKLLVLKHQLCL